MRIRKRLHINVVVSVVTALLVIVMLSLAVYRVNRAMERADIADDIVKSAFERSLFREDYLRTNSERARIQWFARHEQIGLLLNAAAERFKESEDKELIDEMIRDHEATGNLFASIVANRKKSGLDAASAVLSHETEQRLATQLAMRLYDKILYVKRLQSAGNVQLLAALKTSGWSFICAIALITATVIINSWTMGRAIAGRAGKLRDGASIIGGGDLDHRIDLKGDDEFSEISAAFNAMTAKLSWSCRDLENEINERKRAEEVLMESEQGFRALYSTMSEGLAIHELIYEENTAVDYLVIDVNPAYERITGFDRGFAVGRKASELYGAGEAPYLATYAKVALTGEPDSFETYFPPLDKHFAISAFSPGIGKFATIFLDITERKVAEEEKLRLADVVQQEKDRLLALINSITDEVWFADTRNRLTLANPTALRKFGIDEIDGANIEKYAATLEVFRPDGSLRPVEEAPPLRALRGEAVTQMEEIIRSPVTGELRLREISSAPVRDINGAIIGAVSVVRDITERKKAEQALQEAYDELAKQMDERTRELREKEVLLKEIHHRVKNNLQIISSLVGLQADGSTDETVREVLRDVTFRVRSMALVHEKLYRSTDLARIDFAEYVRSLLGYLWRAHGAGAASVRLTLELSPLSLPVDIAVPLGLILNELAGNALKHAFRGRSEGEVNVSLRQGEEGRIILSVGDDGVGLPPGLEWRQSRSLGLRLVHMLSGQIDAGVEVESAEGTMFEISFGSPS
jgi:PAS domain S-box-containing protein